MFGGILPAFGLWADKVDGLTLENVSFRLREGGVDVRPDVVPNGERRRAVTARHLPLMV